MDCAVCGQPAAHMCGGCHQEFYCSAECQRIDFPYHDEHVCYVADDMDDEDVMEEVRWHLDNNIDSPAERRAAESIVAVGDAAAARAWVDSFTAIGETAASELRARRRRRRALNRMRRQQRATHRLKRGFQRERRREYAAKRGLAREQEKLRKEEESLALERGRGDTAVPEPDEPEAEVSSLVGLRDPAIAERERRIREANEATRRRLARNGVVRDEDEEEEDAVMSSLMGVRIEDDPNQEQRESELEAFYTIMESRKLSDEEKERYKALKHENNKMLGLRRQKRIKQKRLRRLRKSMRNARRGRGPKLTPEEQQEYEELSKLFRGSPSDSEEEEVGAELSYDGEDAVGAMYYKLYK